MQPEAVTFLADRKDASLYSIPGAYIKWSHFDLLIAVSWVKGQGESHKISLKSVHICIRDVHMCLQSFYICCHLKDILLQCA